MSIIDYTLTKKRIDRLEQQIDKSPIYGAYWDRSSGTNLTRTHDAVGMVANAGIGNQWVQNDFDNAEIFRELGEVTDEFGNVFIRIPKFYIRKRVGADFRTWEVSKTKYPGFYLPWCFWDFEKNRELPYFDFGKHKASLGAGDVLESKPGFHPLTNRNIAQFRSYAQANGKGYQQLDIHAIDVLRTLMFIEFATLDMQSVMQGFSNGQYSSSHTATVAETATNRIIVSNGVADGFRVGQAIGIGSNHYSNDISGDARLITDITSYDAENTAIVFDGSPIDIAVGNVVANRGWISGFSADIASSSGCIVANDGKYPWSYRGIESPYGDLWQFVDGININDRQAWVCANAENYASNVFTFPYEQLGYINSDTNGYVSKMGYDKDYPYAEFPVEIAGSSSSYYSDYYYQNSGQRIALFGGCWGGGSVGGASCWFLYASSGGAFVPVGGRLLRKPVDE